MHSASREINKRVSLCQDILALPNFRTVLVIVVVGKAACERGDVRMIAAV